MKWIKASEQPLPEGTRDYQKVSIKYGGDPEVIIWYKNAWRWFSDEYQYNHSILGAHRWSSIEWLDEREVSQEAKQRAAHTMTLKDAGKEKLTDFGAMYENLTQRYPLQAKTDFETSYRKYTNVVATNYEINCAYVVQVKAPNDRDREVYVDGWTDCYRHLESNKFKPTPSNNHLLDTKIFGEDKTYNQIKYYAVQYAGFWNIQTESGYGGKNILNSEEVGADEAELNAKRIAWLLNRFQDKLDNPVDPPKGPNVECA